jgi:hypothetical protein
VDRRTIFLTLKWFPEALGMLFFSPSNFNLRVCKDFYLGLLCFGAWEAQLLLEVFNMSLEIVVFGPWNFKCRLIRFQKTLGTPHVFVLGRQPPLKPNSS